MFNKLKKFLKYFFILIFGILVLAILGSFLLWFFKTPSNNKDWEFGQQKMPEIIFLENKNILVKNLRDYKWLEKDKKDIENYQNLEFNLEDIQGLEVGISHFSEKHEGVAHTFLIFNLKNKPDIAFSIESRREKGEEFGIWNALTYNYELIYILATKKDLLDLRKSWEERVYVYPIKASPDKAQKIFVSLSQKANSLIEKPKFYHLFLRNCTNLLVKEVRKVSDKKYSWIDKTFSPGFVGKDLFEMGLIDTDLKSFEEVREKYLIKY